MPEEKCRQGTDQEQRMQPWRRARLTDFESHTQLGRLAVPEVLLDLHTQSIQGHNFVCPQGAKLRRVGKQPRLPGAGFCFASSLWRRSVTGASITLATHRAAAIQHYVAGEAEFARQPAVVPATGFAG